ncbi:hypothetical protein EAF04_003215 [Stromatinia cepivora]|nr:hypothetical protein EAF04_003215 [Stromatinia cepivora]
MTPLSASVFFAGGHHCGQGFGMAQRVTPYQNYNEYLDNIRVIDVYTLSNAWPEGKWMIPVGEVYDLLSNQAQVNQHQPPVTVTGPLTLRSQAMTKFFNTSLLERSADFPRILDRVSVLPNFSSVTISITSANPRWSTFPNSRMLLAKALENKSQIDLSPFYDLTSKRVLLVLERAMIPENGRHVTSLNLSGNKLIDGTVLSKILNAFPNLQTLYLLDTPRIPLARKMQLLQGTKVSEYHDSELYSMPFKSAKGSFGYNGVKPPLSLVTQVIYVLSSKNNISDLHRDSMASSVACEGLFALNLQEINLNLPSMVNGLANFIRVTSYPGTDRTHLAHSTRILAKSMAMLEKGDEIKIAPISNALFQFKSTSKEDEGTENSEWKPFSYTLQAPRTTCDGKWNLIVVSQPYKAQPGALKYMFHQRYAFIRSEAYDAYTDKDTTTGQKRKASVAFAERNEPKLIVADIDQFLQMANVGEGNETMKQEARDNWDRCTSSLDLQMCGKAEVKEVAKEAKLSFAIRDEEGKPILKVFEQER